MRPQPIRALSKPKPSLNVDSKAPTRGLFISGDSHLNIRRLRAFFASIFMAVALAPMASATLPNYASLPSASANTNIFLGTRDLGLAFSNGTNWLLYNTDSKATIANTSPLPSAVLNAPYSFTLSLTNAGKSPLSPLPGSWTIESDFGSPNNYFIDPTVGTITGTPTISEVDTLLVQYLDAAGTANQKLLAINVSASGLTPVHIPAVSPAGGTFTSAQTVTLSAVSGASIFYTLDGSTPTSSSTSYAGPFSVTTSTTVSAIATQSGFAPSSVLVSTYVINVPGTTHKFTPGHYPITPQYGLANSAGTANDFAWIKRNASLPTTGFVWQRHWADLDSATSTVDNSITDATNGTGAYSGFTTEVGNVFNLLQAYQPGTQAGLYVNTIEIWKSLAPGGAFNTSVAPWVMHCGGTGTLTVPNTFGAAPTTSYSMYKYPTTGQCGYMFYAYNSPAFATYNSGTTYSSGQKVYSGSGLISYVSLQSGNVGNALTNTSFWAQTNGNYGFIVGAYQDPGFQAAFRNFFQALSHYVLGASTPYNPATTYTALGQMVSSGGNFYVNISTSNTGNAVSNTAFWTQTTSTACWGQTLDQCAQFEMLMNSDETSATFNQGPQIIGNTSAANTLSYQNYIQGYLNSLYAKVAAFPHTMVGPAISFIIQGTDGVLQDGGTWTAYLAQMATHPGVVYSQADISVTQFLPCAGAHLQNAMAAYVGVNDDGIVTGCSIPAFGSFSPNFIGVMPALLQIEPLDYVSESAADVTKLITQMNVLQATHYLWSVQTNNFNTTDYSTIIYPTFHASGIQPSTVRPSGLN